MTLIEALCWTAWTVALAGLVGYALNGIQTHYDDERNNEP
jgi:hypothetical protein